MAKIGRELIGKRALVTGSNAGIGRAIALRLADEGATHIAIHGRNEERLNAVKAELEAKGVKVHVSRFDISDMEAARQMVKDVIADFGGIDIVISNAGMGYSTPFLEATSDYLEFMFKVNFGSPFVISQEAAKWMIANNVHGVIMLNAALSEYGGLTGQPTYSAMKAAQINLVKSASRVLAPHGIRIVAVSPGFTNTMAMDKEGDTEAKHVRDTLPKVMPLGRMADPEDIAAVFVFMATYDANYITGVNVVADGGVTSDSVSVPWLEALEGRLSGGISTEKYIDPNSERGKEAGSM
jgi:NAD(P)-dependent dehydrogenase (short-subunit alcohol dehydrogenase family)